MPGVGGNLFSHPAARRNESINHNNGQQAPGMSQAHFFQQASSYNGFPSGQMPPPSMHDGSLGNGAYVNQSPIDTNFNISASQSMPHPSLSQAPSNSIAGVPPNYEPMFDPSNPALFNFDLASMNFGNHYGALEFGMLGHMATGAGETPPSDTGTQRGSIGHPHQYPVSLGSFNESPSQPHFPYNDPIMSEWPGGQNIYGPHMHRKDGPHAFAIESNGTAFLSPETSEHTPPAMKFEESPTMSTSAFKHSATSNPLHQPVVKEQPQRRPTQISTPQLKARSQLPVKSTKRTRDPSSIYTTVTAPHSYTSGFHSLIAYLQRRFSGSPAKTLTIAKSLASIRPSFIATTKTLNGDDLIFMEKCFQRTLFEYETFIEGVGTPTIVARRTGEIAAVGKEFQILTGWKKDVLLGRSPNLNVNRGGETGNNSAGPGSGSNTTGRATGVNTPVRERFGMNDESGEKKVQPVFLAELLDDDSVAAFYEDFARLAFGDSRGSVMGKGKLLKYRTKDDQIAQNLRYAAQKQDEQSGGSTLARQNSEIGDNPQQKELKKEGISGQKGMQKLGSRDGKVECTYCWTVKRDVFDIPMLIVMNVSCVGNDLGAIADFLTVPSLHLMMLMCKAGSGTPTKNMLMAFWRHTDSM